MEAHASVSPLEAHSSTRTAFMAAGKEATSISDLLKEPAVTVSPSGVSVRVETSDTTVRRYFLRTPPRDHSVAARRALDLGVQVLALGESTLDEQAVSAVFNEVRDDFEQGLTSAFAQLQTALNDQLGQVDTRLEKALCGHTRDVQRELAQLFAAGSPHSIQHQIEVMLGEQARTQQRQLRELLTASEQEPGNPLTLLRRELSDQLGRVQASVTQLAERLVVATTSQRERRRQVAKGLEYEEAIYAELQMMLCSTGDVVERTGQVHGMKKEFVGDIVVTVRTGVGAAQPRIVLELKDNTSVRYSLARIRNELIAAMANRDAQVGIFVTKDAEAPPPGGLGLLDVAGGMYAASADMDGYPHALALALRLARFDALANATAAGQEGNAQVVRAALKRARESLDRLNGVKGNLSQASKQLVQADRIVDELAAELHRQLVIADEHLSAG